MTDPPINAEVDVTAALGDLAVRCGKIDEQLAEFHRRSAHRESVIDRLHEENQRHIGDESGRQGADETRSP
jgi:hypothetical protein